MSNVLVTGGSRGIGFVVARDLAASGHRVWLCARGEDVLQAARMIGAGIQASQLDVADPDGVKSVFAELQRAWGGVDAVVHAATELGDSGLFWELPEDNFPAVLTANTAGSFYVARTFVRSWVERSRREDLGGRRGKIVLLAGGGAASGHPLYLPYGTSKAAVVRMCETMAMELDSEGLPIDINVVASAGKDIGSGRTGGEVRSVVPFSKSIALSRWLLSADSDHVSGRFLDVNDPYKVLSKENLRPDAFKLRRSE